jgi:transketolase
MAYYAVLAAHGFLTTAELAGFGAYDSILGNHPDGLLVPGVEIASGSLGHGLPIALGTALALEARKSRARVFCLLGDAELDEGSNHEAIAVAGRRRIDRMTAIVIDNDSASYGWPGGIATRFEIEGWSTTTIDGRDHDAIHQALTLPHPGRPHVVVAVVEGRDG